MPAEKTSPRDLDAPKSSRDAIVRAAAAAFLRDGYEGASTDAIAQLAGVSRRTVFNQFEGKEALFSAVVEQVWSTFHIDAILTGPAAADPRTGLTRFCRAVCDFWIEHPTAVQMVRMVIGESRRFPELPLQFFDAGKGPAFRIIIGYLRQANDAGLLHMDDPELVAKQIIGLLNEPLLWPRIYGYAAKLPEKAFVEQVIAETVDMVMARYGAPRAGRAPKRAYRHLGPSAGPAKRGPGPAGR